ncbi:hypothetical protein SAMN04515620_11225 [Collimonas sp. OK607]|nr:hypothetical protein SAMN04515620_11225 [Collimonas sp. OK607]
MPPAICIALVGYIWTALSPSVSRAAILQKALRIQDLSHWGSVSLLRHGLFQLPPSEHYRLGKARIAVNVLLERLYPDTVNDVDEALRFAVTQL